MATRYQSLHFWRKAELWEYMYYYIITLAQVEGTDEYYIITLAYTEQKISGS